MCQSVIEQLPEPVIAHVLGYLPTRDAVKTSLLASKWKHRWASIENLNFDDNIPSIKFACMVMSQLKFTLLQKFRLKFSNNHHQIPVINNLIDESLSRCIKEMDLDIHWAKMHSLTDGIFKSDTLTVLKLCLHKLDVPAMISLPNLKVLHVKGTRLKDECISWLVSSCPLLEDLALISCRFKDEFVLYISNFTLKNLILVHNGHYKMKYSFVLDAPKLAYFKFVDCIPQRFTLKNGDSLIEANVDFDTYRGGSSKHNTYKHSKIVSSNFVIVESATAVVNALSDVRFLRLSSDFTKACDILCIRFPVFPKLTKLEYDIDNNRQCCLLQELIECSPNLDSIVLTFNNKDFAPRENIPASVWDLLKVVKKTSFSNNNIKDLQFVKYILRNAVVLEKLDLYSTEPYEVSTESYEVVTIEYKDIDDSDADDSDVDDADVEFEEVSYPVSKENKNSKNRLLNLRRNMWKSRNLKRNKENFYTKVRNSKKLNLHPNMSTYDEDENTTEYDKPSRKQMKDGTKNIMNFQRASKSCKIVVHSI